MSRWYTDLDEGMGVAVAERTVLRKKPDGTWENWGDVSERVALGNSLLATTEKEQKAEYEKLRDHIGKGSVLMSGRHLQHGDENQPSKDQTLFTNCSTSATSFGLVYLLLNGSGVGRSYDDDMVITNWDNAPTIKCVLDTRHPDFDWTFHESQRDAKHRYGQINGLIDFDIPFDTKQWVEHVKKHEALNQPKFFEQGNVIWMPVHDSREGWAQAVELYETLAFEKIHKDKLLVLDFSMVRPKGLGIGGMQGRPSSGPVPFMNALNRIASLKGSGLPLWKQAMFVDHYLAEVVLVGGARRAARIAIKTWRDKSVIDYIQIKRPIEYIGKTVDEVRAYQKDYIANTGMLPFGFLWSSNNSVAVDGEFWELVNLSENDDRYNSKLAKHARAVFNIAVECGYGDGTGEPGFLNVHKLVQNNAGLNQYKDGDYFGSKRYQVLSDTHIYLSKLVKTSLKKQHQHIVNPCFSGDTLIHTKDGDFKIKDLIGKVVTIHDGNEYVTIDNFRVTGRNQPTLKIVLYNGSEIRVTHNHTMILEDGTRLSAHELVVGDRLMFCDMENCGSRDVLGAYIKGFLFGDGAFCSNAKKPILWLYEPKYTCKDKLIESLCEIPVDENLRSDCITLPIFSDEPLRGRKRMLGLTSRKNELCDFVKNKDIFPEDVYTWNYTSRCEFIAGLFDADGTVVDGSHGFSYQISNISRDFLRGLQILLKGIGVNSRISLMKHATRRVIKKDEKSYYCKTCWRLVIKQYDSIKLSKQVDFKRLCSFKNRESKNFFRSKHNVVASIEDGGVEDSVYCCTVPNSHSVLLSNGIVTGQCGEISLHNLSGFCVIGDLSPYFAKNIDDFEDSARAVTRALIRTNTMDSVYRKEVLRTNRIGVGITGVHEYAWKFFKFGFRDLINEKKSIEFWESLARVSRAIVNEGIKYSKQIGVTPPHTYTTVKPAGTTSKLRALTEGIHLPAMRYYLRWVQFRNDDPLVEQYKKLGYPTRELKTYHATTIIGFPTAPMIARLRMGDALVTAPEATMEEQYMWLRLMEKYWLNGGEGEPNANVSNQLSYTLKFYPEKISLDEFKETLKKWQSQIRCCSVMPSVDLVSYEYQPEEPISKKEYDEYIERIKENSNGKHLKEDISREHLDCAGGACPIDFKESQVA